MHEYPLRGIRTGIAFESLPGCVPIYYEVEACKEANYHYWGNWQDLSPDQQAFLIAHYLTKKWLKSNTEDAQNKEMARKSK